MKLKQMVFSLAIISSVSSSNQEDSQDINPSQLTSSLPVRGYNSSTSLILNLIQIYFSYRNIQDFNIYLCNNRDAFQLSDLLREGRYKVRLRGEWREPARPSDPTTGNFLDLTCSKNWRFFKYRLGHATPGQQGFDTHFSPGSIINSRIPLGGSEVEYLLKIRGELQREHLRPFEPKNCRREVWLLWPGDGEEVVERGFEVDSDVVLAGRDGRLWDLGPRGRQSAGTWAPPRPRLPDPKLRYNLQGRSLKAVFLKFDIEYDEARRVEQITDHEFHPSQEIDERYMYVLWDVLATYYNFRLNITLADTWGLRLSNGSFSGMVGILERHEADLGISSCEMRGERFPAVIFVQPLQGLRVVGFFLEERVLGTYKALFTPFSLRVWASVGGLVLLAGATYSVMARDQPSHGLLIVIGILSQQGLSVNPRRLSLRVLSLSLLLLGLILYTYYSAAIMNGLLSPSPVTIHTTSDLIKSSFRVGIANVPYLNIPFNQKRYIPRELIELARAWMEPDSGGLVEVEQGLERVRRGQFSLISDDISLYPLAEATFTDAEKCSIREVQTTRCPLGTPLDRRSHLREMISQGVIRLIENGIAERTKKIWYPEKPLCLGSTVFVHVSLEAVTVAFLSWLLGILLSTAVFVMELILGSKTNAREINKRIK